MSFQQSILFIAMLSLFSNAVIQQSQSQTVATVDPDQLEELFSLEGSVVLSDACKASIQSAATDIEQAIAGFESQAQSASSFQDLNKVWCTGGTHDNVLNALYTAIDDCADLSAHNLPAEHKFDSVLLKSLIKGSGNAMCDLFNGEKYCLPELVDQIQYDMQTLDADSPDAALGLLSNPCTNFMMNRIFGSLETSQSSTSSHLRLGFSTLSVDSVHSHFVALADDVKGIASEQCMASAEEVSTFGEKCAADSGVDALIESSVGSVSNISQLSDLSHEHFEPAVDLWCQENGCNSQLLAKMESMIDTCAASVDENGPSNYQLAAEFFKTMMRGSSSAMCSRYEDGYSVVGFLIAVVDAYELYTENAIDIGAYALTHPSVDVMIHEIFNPTLHSSAKEMVIPGHDEEGSGSMVSSMTMVTVSSMTMVSLTVLALAAF